MNAATSPASRPTVALTRWVFDEVLLSLQKHVEVLHNQADTPLSPEALRALLGSVDAAIVTTSDRIDATVLPAVPSGATAGRLRLISTASVGYNHIDLVACRARGIAVTHTPDVLTEATADFGFALLLAAARRVGEGERLLRAGRWQRWSLDYLNGQSVFGATLGIYGMGRIGQALALRGAGGFGMRVRYHNRRRLPAQTEQALGGAVWVEKQALFEQSDFVVVVAPYSAETHHAVGAREIAAMPAHGVLINLARGGMVDELALAQALRDGRIAAAGLDVFEGEPTVRPELLALENAVLTPHIASSTRTTRMAMAQLAVDNVLACLGFDPKYPGGGHLLTPVPVQ